MRLGLALAVQHPPEDPQATRFAEHLAQVRAARAAGFSHVWASQHYLSAPYTYFQPLPTLGRVAAESGDMALGTGVLLLPLHSPVDVAEQVATLDVITGGRFIFGVGLGYRRRERGVGRRSPRPRRPPGGRARGDRAALGRRTRVVPGQALPATRRADLAAATAAAAPADLAGRERRRRREAGGAAGRRVADESAHDAADPRAPAGALPRGARGG